MSDRSHCTPQAPNAGRFPRCCRGAAWPLVVALVAVLVVACSKPEPTAREEPRPVRTLIVSSQPNARDFAYPAEIRPRIESRLGFRVAGKITERLVDAGANVKPGQVLARLDARDLSLSRAAADAQVASARANFELAQIALQRTQALAARNFVSAAQIDQAQTQLRAAKGQLDAAVAQAATQGNQADYATLVADRAGVVTAVEAEVGQVASVGATVVRVAVGSDKDVVFNLPEQAARTLTPGQSIGVTLWSLPGKRLTAVVRDVAPAADPQTRTYPIKASLADPDNVAALGLTASAHLTSAPGTNGIVVPLTAVVRNLPLTAPPAGAGGASARPDAAANREATAASGDAAVWIVDQGVAHRVPVKIAGPAGNGLVIESGLAAGQQVITAGVHTIKEGQKVKPMSGS